MTADQHFRRERIRTRAKTVGVGGLFIAGAITLLFTLARFAAAKAVEQFDKSYVGSEEFKAYVNAQREEHIRDSIVAAFDQREKLRRFSSIDSVLACVRASQLHKRECE